MTTTHQNDPFGARATLQAAHGPVTIYRLDALSKAGAIGDIAHLPHTIKILIEAALRQVDWPGRWQELKVGGRRVILDASHNPEGATVLGVSTDDETSHRKFREHHELPFTLLSDEGAAVSTAYGTWGEKVLYGRTFIGMTRSTFVIGPDGVLLKVWKRARAEGHGAAVLAALNDITTRSGSVGATPARRGSRR